MAPLSHNVTNAYESERSNRAHPSVSTDVFYYVPGNTENAPPGTLLKLEKQTYESFHFTFIEESSVLHIGKHWVD